MGKCKQRVESYNIREGKQRRQISESVRPYFNHFAKVREGIF